jgi:hypothetical protein
MPPTTIAATGVGQNEELAGAGWLLLHFWWGSVFLITMPLVVVALAMVLAFVPSHVNEATDPVDSLGGVLSVLFVAALVLAINFEPAPNAGDLAMGLAAIAVVAGIAFFIRQRRAKDPLYDLHVAGRRILWVVACAGMIVFGTLMGATFVGQQFLQNVLGYSTLDAGLAILPAAVFMVLTAPQSAKLVKARRVVHAAYWLCLLPVGLPDDVRAVEGRDPVLEGRPCLCFRRNWRRVCRPACRALPHRFCPCRSCWHGVGDCGSAA